MDRATPTEAEALRHHQDDVDLVRATRSADPTAVDRFIERMRCVPRIVAALNRRAGGRFSAEELGDVTQDTLTTIWRRLDTYEGRAALESWVFRVCAFEMKNRLRTRARADRRTVTNATEALAEREMSSIETTLDFDDLHNGLAALGPPADEILRLKHFDELTFDEIGARLGLSPNTAKSYYYRGLLRLRRILSHENPDGAH